MKAKVYYDGLCVLCSKEIDHYRRQTGSDSIDFIDITSPQFDAASEGLDPFLVHKVMHVKTPSGELKTEVDAFIAIWEQLPKYKKLATLAQRKSVHCVLNFGYKGFVVIRPYLPRKKQGCENSPYCETRTL